MAAGPAIKAKAKSRRLPSQEKLSPLESAGRHMVGGRAAPTSQPARDNKAERAVQALLQRQRAKLRSIFEELEANGRKTSHWAWWVFPTEMPGASEPGHGTFVTADTASRLFEEDACGEDWRQVLETICDLVEARGQRVLPSIDHGRVHYFIKFWSALPGVPDWMGSVLQRLNRFGWE